MSENKQVGKLDARCALDHSRHIRQYLEAFNGQNFGVTENSVDRRNLGIALDNLEETAAMLMNMANRVIELEAAVLSASAGEKKDDFDWRAECDRLVNLNDALLANERRLINANFELSQKLRATNSMQSTKVEK